MIKIDLTEYKDSKIYFQLFDKIIKEKNISKEIFLQDNNINPSTYRRCKKEECNVGEKIIIKLCELLNYKYLDNNQIDELEQLLNNIYSDMYYKIYKNYDNYLEQIDKYINDNTIIYPVLLLFKCYLLLSTQKNEEYQKNNVLPLYNDLKQYEYFYNESCLKIYHLLYLSFEEEILEKYYIKKYEDASAYFILSFRALNNKKYSECLYFSEKAKEKSIEDYNIQRVIAINNNILASYMELENYEDCLTLSEIQLKVLSSINSDNKILIRGLNNKYMICLLYLKKYDVLNKYINENESFDYTKLGIYMTCKYHYNKEEYNKLYDSLIKEQNEKHIIFINNINELLTNKTKKSLKEMKNSDISNYLIKFFENYAFS